MPSVADDAWINGHTSTHDLSAIEDCAIAVDATYYLRHFLDNAPSHEPLLSALGGLTGIDNHIDTDLDQWQANKITPFFIFDGQPVTGQDEVSVKRGRAANLKTDEAWDLYFQSHAEEAVNAFGINSGAFRVQSLYPMLMGKLKARGLHFLVPPFNASAQLAYFEMVDSDQCGGVMGSQELLLYPIRDCVIRSFDWEAKQVTVLSKKNIIRALNITEPMFIDALLMTGTSFLSHFPPLQDTSIIRNQPFTISDAVNLLRTADKSITSACVSFNDILQIQDPNWLDKYRKARMAVNHFIYIAESGEVLVHDFEHLTHDNYEYLGFQLPSELFHYLNTGLIGPRVLGYITHGQILVQPTLDGVMSAEYRKLVQTQLVPIKAQTLALIMPRLNRGLHFKNITMKVWFDDKYSHTIEHRVINPQPIQRAATWDVKEAALRDFFPSAFPGLISTEILALKNPDFVKTTFAKDKIPRGIDSADIITSIVIWRFLHLRGYVSDEHCLTNWGNALAKAFSAIKEDQKELYYDQRALYEAILIAFELLRFQLLNGRNQHEELRGLPLQGTDHDKSSLLLISRCATLLKLRHEANGYTGPLNKNLLAFRSLSSSIRETDRDLVEAIVASMFTLGQSERDRDDQLEINQRLPFANDPDIALGIAVKTFMDEVSPTDTREERVAKMEEFPPKYVPFATHFVEDVRTSFAFFEAIYQGVQTLDDKAILPSDRLAWDKANEYLQERIC